MNAPAAATPRSALKDRLESALNSGASPEALMAEIAAACSASSNAAWEALALIDQYYRRRRLTQDAYRSLKMQTERMALGRAMHAEPGPKAPPRIDVPPAGPRTAPPAAAGLAARPVRSRHAADLPDGANERTGEQPMPVEPLPPRESAEEDARSTTGSFIPAPRAGQLLRGRYRLEARLDYGGGVVFQALDEFRKELPEEEQRVAIRFPTDVHEAQREFYRAQHLSHPNIARLIEFDRDGELAFYTMELVHGRLLRDVLKQATHLPLPQPEALGIIRDVAAALEHAHARQVVHGHLDSASVLITQDGSVQVLNFGLPNSEGDLPEPRDDLTALSLIAYELLAGFRPYEGRALHEARERRMKLRRPPGLQAGQWRALQRGLAHTDKAHALTLGEWLKDLGIGHPAGRPVTPEGLGQAQPAGRWPRPALLGGGLALVALVVAVPAYRYFSAPAVAPVAATTASAPAPTLAPAPAQAPLRDSAPVRESVPPPVAAPPVASVTPAAAPVAAPAPSLPEAGSVRTPPVAAPTPSVAAAAERTATERAAAAERTAVPVDTADTGAGVLAFQAESFTVAPGETAARIPVRRTGSTRGDVGLAWSTEDGSAHAGEDFVSFGVQREAIPSGQKSVTLYIPLSADKPRDVQSEFYVTLSEPAGGARLGRISRLKVIIAPDRG